MMGPVLWIMFLVSKVPVMMLEIFAVAGDVSLLVVQFGQYYEDNNLQDSYSSWLATCGVGAESCSGFQGWCDLLNGCTGNNNDDNDNDPVTIVYYWKAVFCYYGDATCDWIDLVAELTSSLSRCLRFLG